MFRPCPKPMPRVVDRVAYKRELDLRADRFRRAVWARDEHKCRACRRLVFRLMGLDRRVGHVHHRRGRNVAPGDRYNVDQAVLLCATCHADPAVIQRFRRKGE